MTSQVLPHLAKGERLEPPEECPPGLYPVMRSTWQTEPSERPSFSELLETLLALRHTSTHPQEDPYDSITE